MAGRNDGVGVAPDHQRRVPAAFQHAAQVDLLAAAGEQVARQLPQRRIDAFQALVLEHVFEHLPVHQAGVGEQLHQLRLQGVAVGRVDEALQVVAVDLCAEAGAADQGQRQHPLRRQAGDVERYRAAHGVPGQVRLLDVEMIEQGQYRLAQFVQIAALQGLA
ncbi:hypothetical protein D9M71_677510 [compost metagenome]